MFDCYVMASRAAFYELRPNKLGRLVYGIDLAKPVSEEAKKSIIDDVREHRVLVFKDQVEFFSWVSLPFVPNFSFQGVLPHERHLEIARWFGNIESTFYDHSKSPHRDIFRVSNDRSQG